MNAAQLVSQVEQCGGRLWLEGETITVRLPKVIGGTLAPQLRARKAEIIELLNHRSVVHKPVTSAASPHIWHFIIDGKGVTAIDPECLSENAFSEFLVQKFGPNRVQELTLMRALYAI